MRPRPSLAKRLLCPDQLATFPHLQILALGELQGGAIEISGKVLPPRSRVQVGHGNMRFDRMGPGLEEAAERRLVVFVGTCDVAHWWANRAVSSPRSCALSSGRQISKIRTTRSSLLSFHASCSIVSSNMKSSPSRHSRISLPTRK